jgi:hypothetical protein
MVKSWMEKQERILAWKPGRSQSHIGLFCGVNRDELKTQLSKFVLKEIDEHRECEYHAVLPRGRVYFGV